jgi:hypothetical protein
MPASAYEELFRLRVALPTSGRFQNQHKQVCKRSRFLFHAPFKRIEQLFHHFVPLYGQSSPSGWCVHSFHQVLGAWHIWHYQTWEI